MRPYSPKLNALEQEFVEQSRRFKLWVLRAILLSFLGIISVISVAAIYSNQQRMVAEDQRELATRSAELERVQRLRADSIAQEEIRQREIAETERIAADSARASEAIQREIAQQEAARAEREAERARREAQLAEIQRNIAERRRIYAELKEQEADSAKRVAQEETQKALDLLMQSTSRAMAIKSLQLEDDALRIPLAVQAYTFHRRHGGKTYDTDMYTGLYEGSAHALGRSLSNFYGQVGTVRDIAIHPDGEWMLSGGGDGRLLRWNMEGDKREPEIIADLRGATIHAVDISANGRFLLYALENVDSRVRTLGLYRIDSSGFTVMQIPWKDSLNVYDAAFLPDNSGFLFCAGDKKLYRYDLQQHAIRPLLEMPERGIEIAIDPEMQGLAVLDRNHQLHLWKLNALSAPPVQPEGSYYSVTFSPEGAELAAGTQGAAVFWETHNWDRKYVLRGHSNFVRSLTFSPDGKLFASGDYEGKIQMWNRETEKFAQQLPVKLQDGTDNTWVMALHFTPGNQRLMAGYRSEFRGDNPNQEIMQLKSWITTPCEIAELLSPHITRSLSPLEWEQYVGPVETIPYEETVSSVEFSCTF